MAKYGIGAEIATSPRQWLTSSYRWRGCARTQRQLLGETPQCSHAELSTRAHNFRIATSRPLTSPRTPCGHRLPRPCMTQ